MHFSPYGTGEPAPIKSRLSAYLRQEATWRDEKADDYPDDPRNSRSAETLRALAAHVDGLPDGDENARALEALQERYALDLFAPGDEAEHLISRLGFHGRVYDYDAVLRQPSQRRSTKPSISSSTREGADGRPPGEDAAAGHRRAWRAGVPLARLRDRSRAEVQLQADTPSVGARRALG